MKDVYTPYGLPAHAVEKLRNVFRQWPQISVATLYGSRAKGSYRDGSDIDLTLEGDALSLTQLSAIENAIDDLLLPWSADLSIKDRIENRALLEHIERVGVTFYRREEQAGV